MSSIGESILFEVAATRLRTKLKEPGLTPEEIAEIRKDLDWYEKEARHAWRCARQEALAEGY